MKITENRITSRSNPTLMHAASLSEKKYRDASEEFVIEGEKLVLEAIDTDLDIRQFFVCESGIEKIRDLLEKIRKNQKYSKVPLYLLPESCYNKISEEKSQTYVAAVVKYLDFSKRCITILDSGIIPENEKLMMLCSIRDPGNVGTIIRSAAAFGFDGVLLSGGCADVYNRKTIRAAMGNLFRIKTYVTESPEDTVRFLRSRGRRVLCAELRPSSVSMNDIEFKSSDVAVVGNEGTGIPESVSALCDGSFFIPISPRVESLNVASAASVIAYHQSLV